MHVTLDAINSRFFIPRTIRRQEKIRLEDFYEVKLKYGCQRARFLIYLGGSDERVRIPKDVSDYLGLKKSSKIVLMAISRITRPPQPKKFIDGNHIDMLFFIPCRTYSKLPVICRECMENDEEFLECWYRSKGRPIELLLKRHVSANFLELCGYYQAEGAKQKLRSRRGRPFIFTNSKERIIRRVVAQLYGLGIKSDSISLYARYNPRKKKAMLQRVSRLASELKLYKERVRCGAAPRIANVAFNVVVNNSLFGETIMGAMNYFRKRFAKKIRTSELYLCYKFLQGLFDGDGSLFVFRDKSLHIRMMLYEANRDYMEDYKKILSNLEIRSSVVKDPSKNLYTLTVNGNWGVMSQFLRADIFALNDKKQERFLDAIREHERFDTLKPLRCFVSSREISTGELRARTGWTYGWIRSWLRRRKKEGIIQLLRKKKTSGIVNNIWCLTKHGAEELGTLLRTEEKLNTLLAVKEGLKRLHRD